MTLSNSPKSTDKEALRHCSRAVLHGIHRVFPPPSVTGHNGADPVSVKKLLKGEGVRAVSKEILGWIIDGATMCIELSEKKQGAILEDLKQALACGLTALALSPYIYGQFFS